MMFEIFVYAMVSVLGLAYIGGFACLTITDIKESKELKKKTKGEKQ